MWGSCFLIPVCLLSHVSTDLSLRFYAAWWREEKILLVPFNKDWHGFELALVQIRDNLYGTEEVSENLRLHCDVVMFPMGILHEFLVIKIDGQCRAPDLDRQVI